MPHSPSGPACVESSHTGSHTCDISCPFWAVIPQVSLSTLVNCSRNVHISHPGKVSECPHGAGPPLTWTPPVAGQQPRVCPGGSCGSSCPSWTPFPLEDILPPPLQASPPEKLQAPRMRGERALEGTRTSTPPEGLVLPVLFPEQGRAQTSQKQRLRVTAPRPAKLSSSPRSPQTGQEPFANPVSPSATGDNSASACVAWFLASPQSEDPC